MVADRMGGQEVERSHQRIALSSGQPQCIESFRMFHAAVPEARPVWLAMQLDVALDHVLSPLYAAVRTATEHLMASAMEDPIFSCTPERLTHIRRGGGWKVLYRPYQIQDI